MTGDVVVTVRSTIGLVPGDRLGHPLFHRCRRAEAKLRGGARDVELASRLAVGASRIPDNLAAESDRFGDGARKVADGDLFAAAEVHGITFVVFFRGGDDSLGGIVDVEELARGRAV